MCSTAFIKVSSDKKNSASRITGDVKFTIKQVRKAQRDSRFLALNLGVRRGGWLKLRPGRFNLGKRTDAHCTGSWLLPRAGLDGCGKSRPTGIRSPDPSAYSGSPHRLRYSDPLMQPDMIVYLHGFLRSVFVIESVL